MASRLRGSGDEVRPARSRPRHRCRRDEAASADGGQDRGGPGPALLANVPPVATSLVRCHQSRSPDGARQSPRFGADGSAVDVVGGVMGWEDVTVLRRATSPVLIGRAGERARLDAVFRSACDGAPVTVLVAGEAGIGKTRLVTEFADDVGAEATVLSGACIDERVPYSPIAEALRSLVRSGWEPGDVGERGWADLGALVPELGWAAGGRRRAIEDGSPGRLQGAFLLLLEELGRERPVVVIVEDLHWSDASTRNLLMYAMRVSARCPAVTGWHVSDRRPHQAPPAATVPRRGGPAAVHRHRRARPSRGRRRCTAAGRASRAQCSAGDG